MKTHVHPNLLLQGRSGHHTSRPRIYTKSDKELIFQINYETDQIEKVQRAKDK